MTGVSLPALNLYNLTKNLTAQYTYNLCAALPIMVGATIFSAVKVNRYICCECGYTEEWIDENDIEKVKSSRKAKQ